MEDGPDRIIMEHDCIRQQQGSVTAHCIKAAFGTCLGWKYCILRYPKEVNESQSSYLVLLNYHSGSVITSDP